MADYRVSCNNEDSRSSCVYHIRTPTKARVPIWDPSKRRYEWKDKAGGYAIQGTFAKYVKGIRGDYYNVVGLPISRLYQELKRLSN